jgi:hypothetical protein
VETTGFLLNPSTTYTGSTYTYSGAVTISLFDSATNLYVISGVLGITQAPYTVTVAGHKALSGVLNVLRLTTQSGADNFDAGSINILYE